MLISSVFMELRSRLRSCNVYITTSIDFNKNCNLKISIQSKCIVLNYYSSDRVKKRRDSLSSIESLSDCYSDEDDEVTTVIPIEDFCVIIPNSMSCLRIEKNNISFRILTESKNGGNFFKELLSANTNDKQEKSNKLKINVSQNDEVKLQCSNCSNVVSNSAIKFDRILELPSSNMDISEWFCHGHSHCHDNTQNQSGNSTKDQDILKPKKTDFLYRLTYFVINSSILSEKTNKFNSKRDIYHCNRCLAWLGLKEKDSVKFFNCETKINWKDVDTPIFQHKNSNEDIPTKDFIYTIERTIKEFNLGFQYTVMCKIVLECSVSSNNKKYLLIWVMDKELQILKNIGRVISSNKVKLQSSYLSKILFKIESSATEEVETWLADPSIVSTEISKNMFKKGVEHLQKMSLKIPEAFRNSNGYVISYLSM